MTVCPACKGSINLDFSLGKVNYLVKSLTEKGLLKLENFKNSKNKLACHYLLTPNVIKDKFNITKKFLHRKEEEYEKMRLKIDVLKYEMSKIEEYL